MHEKTHKRKLRAREMNRNNGPRPLPPHMQPVPPGAVPILGQPRQPTQTEMQQILTAQEQQEMTQTYKQMVCNLSASIAMEFLKNQPEYRGVTPDLAGQFAMDAHNIATAAINRAWKKDEEDHEVLC